MKLEAEQMEKARQSVFDGKSPSNALLSASNKGLSPRKRRNFFRFGQETTTPQSSMMGMGIDDKMSDASSVIEGPGIGGIRSQMAKGALKTPANMP